jgi:serine O-acetyltransferase
MDDVLLDDVSRVKALHRVRRRESLFRLYWWIRKAFSLPLVSLLLITDQRKLIKKDVERWVQILFTRDCKGFSDVLYLLAKYPEFRSLYYYRLSRGNIIGTIGSVAARSLFKPCRALYLTCPEIGPGFFIQHGYATAVSAQKIGSNCSINQCAAIGWTDRTRPPILGDNVNVKHGAKVLGPITIGDNVTIGANAVVVKNVPPNCVVVGVPARIVRRDGIRVDETL